MNPARFFSILRNMGPRYIIYRTWYEFKRKTGLMKLAYPIKLKPQTFISLEGWLQNSRPFFFQSRNDIQRFELEDIQKQQLKESAEKILQGTVRFFNGNWLDLGKDYDWVTNPQNNYTFDVKQHWTGVEDFSDEQGDIKFVWEKSRFCYLYTIIRYDHHFGEDFEVNRSGVGVCGCW